MQKSEQITKQSISHVYQPSNLDETKLISMDNPFIEDQQ